MITNPVLIFGAGATKACGGPLTNEILPYAFREGDAIERERYLELVGRFLTENFHLPADDYVRRDDDFPALPLLLALLDNAIDRRHSFGPAWPADELAHVRDRIEYLIFALIAYRLRNLTGNYYLDLLQEITDQGITNINVISINYDIIVDNSLCILSEQKGVFGFPDYGVDINTKSYREINKYGKLLKLHGSRNWLYCPGCHCLEIGVSDSERTTVKVLDQLYNENPLEPRYSCHGFPCPQCGTFVRPVMITPTHMKDYRNPHISRIWYEAERMLQQADRVIVVGYSLPEDDVDVTYLLKRGLSKVPASSITVVESDEQHRLLREHPVGRRYRSLFGDELDWHTEGFENWLYQYGTTCVST